MKVAESLARSVVSADGRAVAGRVGTRLLADVAEVAGLSGRSCEALAPLRQRRRGHRPGESRSLDMAVMLADGGEAIGDIAVLLDQPDLFGPVASDATAWQVLSRMDTRMMARSGRPVPQRERQRGRR